MEATVDKNFLFKAYGSDACIVYIALIILTYYYQIQSQLFVSHCEFVVCKFTDEVHVCKCGIHIEWLS